MLAGCGDATQPRSIELELSQPTLSLTRGTPATFLVTTTRTNFAGDITLSVSALPAGITWAFVPSVLTAQQDSATLILTPSAYATLGTGDLRITASSPGVESRIGAILLTVKVAGSYTLSLSPPTISVEQGGVANVTITQVRVDGFVEPVLLSVSGAPPGLTTSLSSPVMNDDPVTLSLSAVRGVGPGLHILTITATTPGLSNRTMTLETTVLPTNEFRTP